MSLSKPPTTHIDMILSFFAKHSQKWPILKNRKLKKKIKKYNKMECANKVKLTTQKRQGFVTGNWMAGYKRDGGIYHFSLRQLGTKT